MTRAEDLRSGKGHRDENFPVASRLIRPACRPLILAFYQFVRTADDIADHSSLTVPVKLAHLDALEASLTGERQDQPAGVALRAALAPRDLSPRHAQDLLTAFRRDVTTHRYRDWDELIDYCRYSAMPVGRFVLDVHGESRESWPANDALCAALQIINHLQDCAEDYRNLDRVYLPLDALAAAGTKVEALAEARASPELRACLTALARRTQGLLADSRLFPAQIADLRLALEVSVIRTYAERLASLLLARDPLCERVHLGKAAFAAYGMIGILRGLGRHLTRGNARRHKPQDA
ncbi:MAG: squalene synthase HpnC [Rhizobiales bacterium]|nr:squalene synthase HpnC [Hyphomicrobiales bacterium]